MNKDYSKCEDCGEENETVSIVDCPFAEEINDEEIEAVLCANCYQNRRDDI